MHSGIPFFILSPVLIFGVLSSADSAFGYPDDDVDIVVSTNKPTYNFGDLLTIRGSGAHSYTVIAEIVAPDGETIQELKFIAKTDGDFSTAWIIPKGIEPGKYTIHVSDVIKKAQTTFMIGTVTLQPSQQSSESKTKIPDWIRNNAKWWSEGNIGDSDFTNGIQYMIKENIMVIPDIPEEDPEKMELKDEKRAMGLERGINVPDWVRNNAGWWADGMISDDDFVSGIKYLVEHGIIKV